MLRTKLFIPPLRPNLVPRPHLINRLNHGLEQNHKLTLVSAPAGFGMTTKDKQFFSSGEYLVEQVEAFRQGAEGMTHDFTIERVDWPFELEEIHVPTVLVFHGEKDTMLHPRIGEYVCMRIPSCDEPTIYPGEGHSVVYYRYQEIIQAILETWE